VRRRAFISLLGGAAAWPLAARAQQGVRRVGVLMGYAESNREGQAFVAAFREGLQKLGWSENRNLRIDTRWAISDDADSIQRIALEPDLILSNNTPTTAAMLQQTRTIPRDPALAIKRDAATRLRSCGRADDASSSSPRREVRW
jgi:DNA-binding LacI/PurR family transcriptional regulator